MSIVSVSFFLIYALVLGTIVLLGFANQRIREDRDYIGSPKINSKDIIVLVPFRNEEHRIGPMLESIRALHKTPQEFVFIDDHSDDDTVQLIKQKLEGINYRLIHLPEGITGKKRALRFATEATESKFILTIDSDVELPNDYFVNIERYAVADMYVLPAIMVAKKWHEYLYEIDLLLVTAANAGLAGLSRPIMASGANLFYKRDTFRKVDNLDSHIHAASGDDTYLLRDFREQKTDTRLLTDPSCAITTETPQSFKEFIDQRLRWIGKTGDIKDNLSTSLAVLQAVLTLLFFALLTYFAITLNWLQLLYLFVLKAGIDLLLFMPYFFRLKRIVSWTLIPIYELIFPIYTLIIVVLLFTYEPKWKGRSIYEKRRP